MGYDPRQMARNRIPQPPEEALAALSDWYRQPLGGRLAAAEQRALSSGLANLFGYHLLMVDPPHAPTGLALSRIPHQVVLSCRPENDGWSVGLVASGEALPVQADSVDVMVLPHTLELARDPHQILREAERCLVPEGHLIILGFNPFGWWGLWRLLTRWRGRAPWRQRFLSVPRLNDWLALLGFDTVGVEYLFRAPALHNEGLAERFRFLEATAGWDRGLLAGGYGLVARKRVSTLTPLKPRWRPRKGVLGARIAEPSNRSFRQRDGS